MQSARPTPTAFGLGVGHFWNAFVPPQVFLSFWVAGWCQATAHHAGRLRLSGRTFSVGVDHQHSGIGCVIINRYSSGNGNVHHFSFCASASRSATARTSSKRTWHPVPHEAVLLTVSALRAHGLVGGHAVVPASASNMDISEGGVLCAVHIIDCRHDRFMVVVCGKARR